MENERVHLGNNCYLLSTKTPCSNRKSFAYLIYSTLALCDRYYHYVSTEVTESEKDKLTKVVNGRARICHHALWTQMHAL